MKGFLAIRRVLNLTAVGISLAAMSVAAYSQPAGRPAAGEGKGQADIRGSAAYAEVLLKKTEVQAELEGLAAEYTDDFPKVVETRQHLELIEKERARLLAVKPVEISKLSTALGRLMLKKAEAELELWTLRKAMTESHPDVRRAKRKLEIYEAAIKQILN